MTLEIAEVNIEQELAAAEVVEQKPEDPPEVKAEEVVVVEDKEEKPEKKGDPAIALRQERQTVKELKAQLRRKETEDQDRYAKLQERLDRLQNPPAAKPDFDVDPANHLKGEVDDLKKRIEPITQNSERLQLETQLHNVLRQSEAEFIKETPDYNDAAQYFIKSMEANMEAFGVKDPNAIRNEVNRITAIAMKSGKDPAELVYQLAKNNGYKKVEKTAKLETISKGQEASQSLGSGARAETGALTLDALARMDDEEFNSLVLDEKKWKQVGQLMH